MTFQIKEKEYCIISVMGPHAGESVERIFKRKILDTEKAGKTFWLIKSHQAKPDMIQEILMEAQNANVEVTVYFVEPSTQGGAIPTKTSESAKYYSQDRIKWELLPPDIGPVTGNINTSAYALIMDKLELSKNNIDLWEYANFFEQDKPIKIFQGASTLCAIKKTIENPDNRIKSHIREIVAVGRLCHPGGVWLK